MLFRSVDRLLVKPGIEKRIEASITTAMKLTNGLVQVAVVDGEEHLFSEALACTTCGTSIPAFEPRSFSFNSKYGACKACDGLGNTWDFDPVKLIGDWSKPLLEGGLGPGAGSLHVQRELAAVATENGFDLRTPFGELPKKFQDLVLYGKRRNGSLEGKFSGIVAILRQSYDESRSESYREWLMEYMSPVLCTVCEGRRLRPESLAVRVRGFSIADVTSAAVSKSLTTLEELRLNGREEKIAGRIVAEIRERLHFLANVGLGYLSLDRAAATLSGGEGQRVRLATQIGSKLRGVLYVLDEPSIGLHHRDNAKLLQTLENLRDLGNTVLVVEHDEETIRRADYVLDLGPGAGRNGGSLVAAGTPKEIAANPSSLTGQYISRKLSIPVPALRRKPNGNLLTIKNARANNLKNLEVSFPLGLLTVITGVSGSGKSTLVNDILYRAIAQKVYGAKEKPGAHGKIEGHQLIDKVICIDQAPIGRTPRSNPATYTGLFAPIRELFAGVPEARERGYGAGRFSFNVKGGRCEACQGDGLIKVEMHFLPDMYVACDVCRGRRYSRETLEIRYKGRSIHDVLQMRVSEADALFSAVPAIARRLRTLLEVGDRKSVV